MNTLFTRYSNQEDLFGYIEENYPYTGFKEKRIKAESTARSQHGILVSLEKIYDAFKELSTENETISSFDELMDYEFNLELENSIPIQCNIKRINPDDVYIVDHYFSLAQWSLLLNKHGISEHKIYYKTDPDIPETKRISSNAGSTTAHAITSTESLCYATPIFKKIRAFRLKNPHTEYSEEYNKYDKEASYTLPILLLFCIHVRSLMLQENHTRALFCVNSVYKMFSQLYPDIECILFSTSPYIHLFPTVSYKEYVQKTYLEKTIIVGLHGFFNMDGYLFRELFVTMPRVHLLVDDLTGEITSLTSSTQSTVSIPHMDELAYDNRGTLFSMVDGLELRLHDMLPTPNLTQLIEFSQQCSGLEVLEVDLSILKTLIEKFYLM
jgi:hypothetical protein